MSNNLRIIRMVIFLVFIGSFLGCSASLERKVGKQKIISREGEKGVWITKPSSFDTRNDKAFTGVSRQFKTDVEARNDALKNARQQIIDAMGVYGKRKVNEVITYAGVSSDIIDPGIAVDDMTKLISENYVSTKAKEYYIEKIKEWTENGTTVYYKAYVLVSISNNDVEKQMKETLLGKTEEIKNENEKDHIKHAIDLINKMDSEDW